MVGRPMFARDNSPRTGYSTRGGLSTSQIAAQREGRRNAYYADGTPVPDGMTLNVAGWNTSGVGPGSPGYRGSGRIGSAAGAANSPGIPTSQRGRAEKYGMNPTTGEGAWQLPSWMVGQMQRDQFGMSPAWAYQGMGNLPTRSASPVGSTPGTSPKPADSSTSTKPDPWADRTTYGGQTNPGSNFGKFIGPAVGAIGGVLGIPGSFFGTSVADMLNRQRLW